MAMSENEKHAGTLELRGGSVCLDFANTASWHATDHPREWLESYDDLLVWSQHAGLVSESQREQMQLEARQHPKDAETALVRAIKLREAIFRIFSQRVKQQAPAQEDLNTLQAAYADAVAHAQIVSTANRVTLDWSEEDSFDFPLWKIAHSAMELLTSREEEQVKECPGDGCGWLFIDKSKNKSRRWCNGQDCGNRIRVRQHYHQRKIGNG